MSQHKSEHGDDEFFIYTDSDPDSHGLLVRIQSNFVHDIVVLFIDIL